MNFKGLYTIISGCIVILSSCQPEQPIPDQDKVYVSYGLTYNISLNKTTASAIFTEETASGELIELKLPANIKYNGDDLLFSTNIKTYQKEFIGLNEGEFAYTNMNSLTQTNSVNMVNPVNLINVPDSQSISSNMFIQFETAALSVDESFEIILKAKFDSTELIFHSDSIPSSTVSIDASYLSQIGPGTIIFSLSKLKNSTSLTESNSVGGEYLIKYTIQDTIVLY